MSQGANHLVGERPGGGGAGRVAGRAARWVALAAAVLLSACGYYHYAGPLYAVQGDTADVEVAGEAEARWERDGTEVQVRALSPEELNRQFASRSAAGFRSTNPYTFGDRPFRDGKPERERFAVFHLKVVNEGHAKVKIDPARMVLRTEDGQELWALRLQQLQGYYRAYVTGYEGNAYGRYQERIDVLRRTMYHNEEVFRGQEKSGYVVFPVLPPHVRQVRLVLEDVALRFDAHGEPVETARIAFPFQRDIGRLYENGRIVLEEPRRPEPDGDVGETDR